jgi:uncharacterized protein YdaU (DUF1376 family)
VRSPAFQFYVNDFLGSPTVAMMSTEEVGCYVLLLLLDWQEGGFVHDTKRLAKWCRVPLGRFERAWQILGECFEARDGRLWNPRLEKERTKQSIWRAKSSAGGKKGMDSRWHGDNHPYKDVITKPLPTDNTPFPSPTPLPKLLTATNSRRKKRDESGAARETWLTPASQVYEQRNGAGSFGFGEAGRALKRLREPLGADEIARRLGIYLDQTPPEFQSLHKFAKTHAQYAAAPAPTLTREQQGWLDAAMREQRLEYPELYNADGSRKAA